ncbi:MAG: DUF4202 domain-containing protein [Verrucomicrobia bacterium]|nr:DUF4202 domain-containing protein [Verrucomicrobiota bacterium]
MTHLTHPGSLSDPARFEAAILRFDAENAADPNSDLEDGIPQPRELLYARRLTEWVVRLRPDASEKLRLAARCQHICRWAIPRSDYPMDRPGYLKWRADLKKFHAQKAGEILRETGYDEALVEEVQALNLKKHFPRDADSRVLEDALCLMFLEFQCAELATRTDEEKMVNALRKSWNKMSEQGRAEALKLPLAPPLPELVQRAIAGA